nr:diadenylate cyclase CdaA [Anaerolineae bacterium]
MILRELFWAIKSLPTSWGNILDILLVATIFFVILYLVRGTKAATLLRGIAIALVLLWSLSALLNLRAFSWLLSKTLTAFSVALPLIFHEELRRWLDRLGRFVPILGGNTLGFDERESQIRQIVDASENLSRRRHGALLVLERETGLQEYIDSGIDLDAAVTSELLQTIFFHNSPLHDGAVILRNGRLKAAACTLPISTVRNMPSRTMGLRHRASLGISEVSDAVAIVVSEETGRISVVVGGHFIKATDTERLALILREYIHGRQTGSKLSRWFGRLRGSKNRG